MLTKLNATATGDTLLTKLNVGGDTFFPNDNATSDVEKQLTKLMKDNNVISVHCTCYSGNASREDLMRDVLEMEKAYREGRCTEITNQRL